MRTITGQKGVALITSLFFLVIVTALAAGAIMLATVQVQVAGGMACAESAYAAAEGGESFVIPLLVDIHFDQKIPTYYVGANDLLTESWNDPDTPDVNPDVTTTIGNFTVNVDVDSVGTLQMAGFSIEESIRYHKGAIQTGSVTVYHLTSVAQNAGGRCRAVLTQAVMLKPAQ